MSWLGRRQLALLALLASSGTAHWHDNWEEGFDYRYSWWDRPWVAFVRDFYCDEKCDDRLLRASTIDREFKALVDLFNQTTGGPRDVYRGAFEGLDDYKHSGGALTRRAASLNRWKHMKGWESILTAHTSELTLCTKLRLDGNVSFTRSFCYDNINATQ